MRLCFISSYPPKSCGIAEFNQDLINGLKNMADFSYFGVAINKANDYLESYYDKQVVHQIRRDTLADYRRAADYINDQKPDIVCLQLEFALYGGYDGHYLKSLINNLKSKLIVIVHGSPVNSYSRRKKIRAKFFKEIAPHVKYFVTINPLQKKVFKSWGINKVVNIFHGAPDEITDYQYENSRRQLKIKPDELLIFSFGLLHAKKGLEHLLQACEHFSENNHQFKFLLSGKMLTNTKNAVLTKTIQSLEKLSQQSNQFIYENKFLEQNELFLRLAGADIIVLCYTKRDLVSSGPLSFSILANKFIICTPFPYAKALLTKKTAYFVPYANPKLIEKGFNFYLKHRDDQVQEMQKDLIPIASNIKWSKICLSYYELFKKTSYE
jgi:glycosyltransferase involved in cell wall biosynthesis